jgi:rRNA maturation endonuclease Nob1
MINQQTSTSEATALRMQPRELGKKILYGLPCANCRSYYQSDLAICPICRCGERISQNTPLN